MEVAYKPSELRPWGLGIQFPISPSEMRIIIYYLYYPQISLFPLEKILTIQVLY